ncbi:MAG: STAS domain-containing protein [Magnetococcales bacterium]|nr:STAS domain-containing protein [Magnetococcales bacterium]
MSIVVEQQGDTVVMRIAGIFGYRMHADFMRAVRGAQKGAACVIDLINTDHIDSAGMGMLLMMREMFGGDAARITLINPNPKVHGVLVTAQFQELFKIAYGYKGS